jgi:hypothetical protein
MVGLFDVALGLGCACCMPCAGELPDIVCHACRKVLYTARQDAPPPGGAPELDLTPDPEPPSGS